MATQRSTKSKELAHASKEFVTLAHEFNPAKHNVTGWYWSEKLDGVRCRYLNGKLYSRYQKEFPVPKEILTIIKESIGDVPADGELYCGLDNLQKTVSVVKNSHSDLLDWLRSVKYHIFDVVDEKLSYKDRMIKYLGDYDMTNEDAFVQVVPHFKVKSNNEMLDIATKAYSEGKEGLMVRNPEAVYTYGRSRDLLKVKSVQDMEVEVIEHIEGDGRNQKRLGALRCRLPDGKTFKVGSGFTDQDRENPPPIGSKITIKFARYTESNLPFQPIYLRIREEL
jgi:DNA ligase-1